MEHLDGGEDEKIEVRFVIPAGKTELTVSSALMSAYQQCTESEDGLSPSWVNEDEVVNIQPTKTDVFVLDPFEGPAFEHLTKGNKFKCTVVGPRCLISCLQANTPVPNLPYPMFSIAMKGLTVTCTDLDKDEKAEMKQLVERMAGVFHKDFHDGVTHLVAGSVTSKKYQAAVDSMTPVMTKEWVKEVWKASSRETVSAVDPGFSKYRCPALLGLSVTVSQMTKADKNILQKKIVNHGGSYTPDLALDKTNLLICLTGDGDKYSYASKWKIPCVHPDWVYHSVDKGYALPQDDYKIDRKKNKASTPTKQDITVTGLAEVSMCSTILNPDDSAITSRVDETVNSTVTGTLEPVLQGKQTSDWLAELDLARVKKSGHFLDNLKIYLSGFTEKDQVLLTRVLKYAGATRLTQLVDSVTHVVNAVARQVEPDTTRILKELDICPHCVSLEWMVESMKRGQKVSEQDYFFPPQENKDGKGDQTFKSPPKADQAKEADSTRLEDNILDQYKQNKTEIEDQTTMGEETDSQVEPFFDNLKFQLLALPEEEEQEITEWINQAGGEIVFSDYTGIVDILITPISGGESRMKYKKHYNTLWIDDCFDTDRLVEEEYYHLALKRKLSSQPLHGIVTCVSGYTGRERIYINKVIELMGGLPQEMFAKKANADKGVKASTHLLCPESEGQKYNAAVKWGLPVVSKDWLRACTREEKWISEKPFLIGNAKSFSIDKPMPSLTIEDDISNDRTIEQDTTLQDIDQNQSATRRRSTRDSMDKSEIILRDVGEVSKRNSLAAEDLQTSRRLSRESDRKSQASTPVTTKKRESVVNLGTPGDLLKAKPMDFYSPLPSQPWPASQDSQTPTSGAKRKREGGLDDMPTPKTPYGEHLGRNPSPATRKFFKKRYDDLRHMTVALRAAMPEKIEAQNRMQKEWLNTKPGPSKGDKELSDKLDKVRKMISDQSEEDVTDKDQRSLDEKMAEVFQAAGKDWYKIEEVVADKFRELEKEAEALEEAETNTPLAGLVVCIAKKIAQMNKELEGIVEELGGSVADHLDLSVSHFIFQGKAKDLSKEFRAAKEAGKYIVSPDWIYMCRSERRKVDESAFPHTYNTRASQSFSQTGSQRAAGRNKTRVTKDKLPQPVFEEGNEEETMDTEAGDDTAATHIIAEETPVNKKVGSSYKKDIRALESLMENMKNSPSISLTSKHKPMKLDMTEEHTPTATPNNKEEKDKESQVLWVDPEEERKREALALKLSLETQDFGSLGSINFSENMTAAMETDVHRVFMFAGGIEEKEMQEAVAKLGGEVNTKGYFEPSTTHIITAKVNRSEKMLGCIAAGRWVLHPSYLKDSLDAGLWLQEENYEWGNPENKFLDLTGDGLDVRMSVASRRRRLAEMRGEPRIFNGIQAFLGLPSQKQGPFSRLLIAGGGRVLDDISTDSLEEITHVLTENKYFSLVKGKMSTLGEFCIPVIQPVYLSDYLTSEKHPAVDKYLVDEYRSLWEGRKRSRVTTDTPTNPGKKNRI